MRNLRFWLYLSYAIFVACLAGLHHVVPYVIAEGLLFAAIIMLILSFAPFRNMLRSLSWRLRSACYLLIVLMFLGHVIKQKEITFPFVAWTMYGRIHEDEPVYYEWTAVTQNDSSYRFEPWAYIPGLAKARLYNRLETLVENATDSNSVSKRNHDDLVSAFAEMRNDKNAHDKIMRIEVFKCVVPIKTINVNVQRELLWSVKIGSN